MAWFDCATRRAISHNVGGTLASQRGLVLHHQAGNGSLYGWFNNPSAKVSAHFWVSKGGAIEQYVDTARVAWHGIDLNSNWVAVETEGCPGGKDEPMTAAMESALARLYREGNRRHGWVNQLASSNGGRGFGYHRMAVNTACPCNVRLNRRGSILAVAFGGAATPAPPPQTGGGTAPKFSATPYFDQKTNSRHPDVKTWQNKMRSRGWGISADGIYGPQSEDACRKFQREKGLAVDGKVGPQTWSTTWTAPVT